jgi:hypothetical protein
VALRIIKYLGRSSDVTLDDIPLEYRNNPNVEPFILSHSLKSRAKKDAMLRNYRHTAFSRRFVTATGRKASMSMADIPHHV